ncbi:DUF3592 domain-containing protein [Rathayibacter sp. CAU 1779]
MTFDYRARPTRTTSRGLIVLVVAGIALLIACGIWVFTPIIADTGRATATGTIVSYRLEVVPTPGTAPQFRPTIRYSVNGREYTLTASQTVTAPDRRQLPVGSETSVRYDPSDPASASWMPGGNVVAVNVLGIAGFVAGFGMLVGAVVLRRWNRRGEQNPAESGET